MAPALRLLLVLSLLVEAGAACVLPRASKILRAPSASGPTDPLDLAACPIGEEFAAGRAEPAAEAQVVAKRKKRWEARFGGADAAQPAIRARLRGWPGALVQNPGVLPAADAEFLMMLARDTWLGISNLTDRLHHLPVDHVDLRQDQGGRVSGHVADYANVTTIGFYLMSIVAAQELGLVTPGDAEALVRGTLRTLDRLERHGGFYFNYYDTTSLERTSNFISFVDSAWLAAGLIVARHAIPSVRVWIDSHLERMDFAFFYDRERELMSHGFYVHTGEQSKFHYGVLYAESRLGSLLAIGLGQVPASHWQRMIRTFPPACRWQSQQPSNGGRHTYLWNGIRYVPSWGGSMFEALMPTLVLDETRLAPRSLGPNAAAHVAVQRRYGLETLGLPVWGMSPSMVPSSGKYGENGVRPLGAVGYPSNAVTPHASALALTFEPEAATRNLRELAERFPLYGEFGFYDAVDPRTGRVANTYLLLDQEMILISLANHMREGVVQRYFQSDPAVEKIRPLLESEIFFN